MKILKMSFCFFLTAIFILMITGCGKEEPQEAEIEGYREEQVELPYKDTVYTSLIQRGESIRIADTYGHCLTSMDNGKTFKEEKREPDIAEGWEFISNLAEAPDGNRILVGYTDAGKYEVLLKTADGEAILLSGFEQDVYPKAFYGDGFFYILQGGKIYQIEPAEGKTRFLLENKESAVMLAADRNFLYVVESGGVFLYDLEKETAAESDNLLSEFMEGKAQLTETGGYSVALYPYGDGIYIAMQDGVYWHTLYGDTVDLVMNGSRNNLANVGLDGMGFQGMTVGESGIMLIAYSDGKLMRYIRNDAPASAQNEDYIRIYSVYRESDIQKLVKQFQEKYPEIPIRYEVGVNSGNGMTGDDALKNLSTEMAAGKGPDILVMDDIPYESYVEKGALMDLKELRGKLREEEYFTDVIDGFGNENGLYILPLTYSIPILVGNGDVLAETEDLETLAGLANLLEKADNGQETLVFNFSNAENLLCLLAQSCQGAWVGRDGSVNREAVADFFTQAKRIYEIQKDKKSGLTEEVEAAFLKEEGRASGTTALERRFGKCVKLPLEDKAAVFPGQAFCVSAWNGGGRAFMELKGFVDYIGDDYCLMPGQMYGTCLPQTLMAINSMSEYKEEGSIFLEYALSEEFQRLDSLGGTPVNRKAYYVQQENPNEKGHEGEACGHTTVGGVDTIVNYFLYWPEEDEFRKLDDIIDCIKGINICDLQVYNAVIEIGQSVLTGDTEVQEGVEEVAGRVQLYLNE